jgi:hypothetical protein
MIPHVEEYRRLKERARAAKRDIKLRSTVAREIAHFVVSQLRAFGLSDGALCAWANLEGYETYSSELAPFEALGRYRALHDSMWSLARHAGIAHETSGLKRGQLWWKISSEPLLRANRSVVWAVTKEFRSTTEAEKTKLAPKKQDAIFYEPQPYERTSLDVRGWV